MRIAQRRIAGYHLSALELMVADLDAEHRRQSLLSAEEFYFQLEGLAGPRRELPDRRVHELFEQQVAAHADAVAAVCGEGSLTYGQLNARANRLARALLARGLGREGVVGGGDGAESGLAGCRARGVQGRWCVFADRAAFPGRSHCGDAYPRRLRSGADRTRQHRHLGPGPHIAAGCPDAFHRCGLRGGSSRRQSWRRGCCGSAGLHLFHLWFDW